jgi:hypothetical protein
MMLAVATTTALFIVGIVLVEIGVLTRQLQALWSVGALLVGVIVWRILRRGYLRQHGSDSTDGQ